MKPPERNEQYSLLSDKKLLITKAELGHLKFEFDAIKFPVYNISVQPIIFLFY